MVVFQMNGSIATKKCLKIGSIVTSLQRNIFLSILSDKLAVCRSNLCGLTINEIYLISAFKIR